MREEKKRATKGTAEVSRTREVERIQVGPYRQTIVFTGRSPSRADIEGKVVEKYAVDSSPDVEATVDESSGYQSARELKRSLGLSLAFVVLSVFLTIIGISSYIMLVTNNWAMLQVSISKAVIYIGVLLLVASGIISWRRASRLRDIRYLERRRLKKKEQT